jgi:hypothetical protein
MCLEGHPQATPPTNNTCNSAAVKGSVVPPHGDRSSLRHAVWGSLGLHQGGNCDPSTLLSVSDINCANPTMVCVVLRQSKTDLFQKGVSIFLGRTYGDLFPVASILGYIAVRPPGPSPLFMFNDGSYLTRDKLVGSVRLALMAAGVGTKGYSGHCFRIGVATTAAQKGVEDARKMGISSLPTLPAPST